MKASEAREIYVKQYLSQALNAFYDAIRLIKIRDSF